MRTLEEWLKPLEKPAKAMLLVAAITAGVIGAAGIAAAVDDDRSECEKHADVLYDYPSAAKAQFTRMCEANPDD